MGAISNSSSSHGLMTIGGSQTAIEAVSGFCLVDGGTVSAVNDAGGFGLRGMADANGSARIKVKSNGVLVGVVSCSLDEDLTISAPVDGAADLTETTPNNWTLTRPTGQTVTLEMSFGGNVPTDLWFSSGFIKGSGGAKMIATLGIGTGYAACT